MLEFRQAELSDQHGAGQVINFSIVKIKFRL